MLRRQGATAATAASGSDGGDRRKLSASKRRAGTEFVGLQLL